MEIFTSPNSGKSELASRDRLRAATRKAVGGTLNLIRELARVSASLEAIESSDSSPSESELRTEQRTDQRTEKMVKRIQFFAFELQADLGIDANPETFAAQARELNEAERIQRLNQFFFAKKNFQCVTSSTYLADPSEPYRLDYVLAERTGSPFVLALIYAFLAERIGIDVEFVDLKPTCYMKMKSVDNGRSRYIDMTRQGATLSTEELIETLHTRFQKLEICHASLLETYSFEAYLAEYVCVLKSHLPVGVAPEGLLFLQNTLVSYQPSNLQLLAERSLLHRRLGNFKSALADLKRYFAFHDRLKAPPEYARLHDELVQLLEPTHQLLDTRD